MRGRIRTTCGEREHLLQDGSENASLEGRCTVPRPVGLHRVLAPTGPDLALPQAAERLDDSPQIGPDEVRIDVEVLNLDAASYRQLSGKHTRADGTVDGAAVRAEVLEIVAARGKMQNPVKIGRAHV